MSDRFVDRATYYKRDNNTNNKAKYDIYMRVYEQYAKAVNINDINDNFKNIVDEFRNTLEISPKQRLNTQIKQKWINYFNSHK
jgi:hypothetical protein